MSTVTIAMIVKNEAEMAPGFLESVRGLWDELLVVDTGSTDGTVELFEAAGAKVLRHPCHRIESPCLRRRVGSRRWAWRRIHVNHHRSN